MLQSKQAGCVKEASTKRNYIMHFEVPGRMHWKSSKFCSWDWVGHLTAPRKLPKRFIYSHVQVLVQAFVQLPRWLYRQVLSGSSKAQSTEEKKSSMLTLSLSLSQTRATRPHNWKSLQSRNAWDSIASLVKQPNLNSNLALLQKFSIFWACLHRLSQKVK